MSAEKKLKELGLDLGTVSAPVANYVNAVRTGNLLFLAGKGPRAGKDGKRPLGKVGREYSAEQAYEHARGVGLDLLAVMRAELGSLDKVKRVVIRNRSAAAISATISLLATSISGAFPFGPLTPPSSSSAGRRAPPSRRRRTAGSVSASSAAGWRSPSG